MSDILQLIAHHRVESFEMGSIVIKQGGKSGPLLVLIKGEVEILRDNVRVAKVSEAGAIFGEMSVLLGCANTATVRALQVSSFAVIENPRQFLASSAEMSLHVAGVLAARLSALNKYLVDVKQQYEGHDHIGMVDEPGCISRQPVELFQCIMQISNQKNFHTGSRSLPSRP